MMMLQGDPVQNWQLLNEALNERSYFLQTAPYLNRELKLLVPHESFVRTMFWHYPGTIGYHLMYLRQLFKSNYTTSVSGPVPILKSTIRCRFPEAKQIHNMHGVIMHEAQMIDSRMALNALLTASIDNFIPGMKGANLLNYTEFVDFLKDDTGKIIGAELHDRLSGEKFKVRARCVVNCAGIHADELRLKDDEKAEPRIVCSRGTHLIFKRGLLPEDSGIIIPKTRDGRILFICNYLGHPMVGTTDEKCEKTHHCEPT